MNKKVVIIVLVVILAITGGYYGIKKGSKYRKPIKVGILHSLTGTMAISGKSVVDATLMAIEEINDKGGLLGRRIESIVVDGCSDNSTFAKEAHRLITEEKVSVIFGCWTSSSRKTIKPIIEKYNHLLFYPRQYEGLESSSNIVYTGAAANQQIIPAVKWASDNLGKRFFLVGSDSVFPRTANAIIKDQITALRGEVVGEEYVLLGSKDFKKVAEKIIKIHPDVILNTLNGDSNIAFVEHLHYFAHKSGIRSTSKEMPIISFSIAENELRFLREYLKKHVDHHLREEHNEDADEHDIKKHIDHLWNEHIVGSYAAWNYFQSIDSEENKQFVENFKKRYGLNRVTDDPMEAAYVGVYLWSQAVKEAGTDDVNEVLKTVKNQSVQAPGGMVYINSENNHTWKAVRIGKIRKDGQFDIVWDSEKPIRPVPYPIYRSKSEWDKFLQDIYEGWGKKWVNPGR